jgi:hypothetical protein
MLIIKKLDSKNEAIETAKNLAYLLNIKYFDFDLKLVRQVLLGQVNL